MQARVDNYPQRRTEVQATITRQRRPFPHQRSANNGLLWLAYIHISISQRGMQSHGAKALRNRCWTCMPQKLCQKGVGCLPSCNRQSPKLECQIRRAIMWTHSKAICNLLTGGTEQNLVLCAEEAGRSTPQDSLLELDPLPILRLKANRRTGLKLSGGRVQVLGDLFQEIGLRDTVSRPWLATKG